MTTLFAVLLSVHGAIHLLGAAKAFHVADLPQLTRPVSPGMGLVWLLAAVLFIASAGALWLWPRWWWAMAGVALLLSTLAIASSWADARFGMFLNALVVVGVVFGALAQGPWSLRAEYDRDAAGARRHGRGGHIVTEADLASLPAVVQHYLHRTGVVGQPRVSNARMRMHGRIRSAPNAAWMPFAAEQYNVLRPAMRLFYLTARMRGVPVQGYHRYVGSSATMRIRAAALMTVADAAGPEMNQGETVTLLNDLCVLLPPMLVDAPIGWEELDAHSARARFTNAGQTVSAVLTFDDSGDLIDFQSDDRYESSADGRTMTKRRWSTPVTNYRPFGAYRLSSAGQARWHDRGAEWAYIELTVDTVEFNVAGN